MGRKYKIAICAVTNKHTNHATYSFVLVDYNDIMLKDIAYSNTLIKIHESTGQLECAECHSCMNTVYSNIIMKIEKAGLLPDDFRPLCCGCLAYERIKVL